MKPAADLGDVPLETSVAISDARRLETVPWDAQLQKNRDTGPRLVPTHAILGGLGHPLGRSSRFTIGLSELGADLSLPASFSAANCSVPLLHEGGRMWFVDSPSGVPAKGSRTDQASGAKTPIDAGDRLTIRCGTSSAEILFAHCPGTGNGARLD